MDSELWMLRRDENVPMPARRKKVVELECFIVCIVEEKQPLAFLGLQPLQSIVCRAAYTLE
jgi:hypothetical protein